MLVQAEEVQHQLGDKFDRLSETAKSGMLRWSIVNFVHLPVTWIMCCIASTSLYRSSWIINRPLNVLLFTLMLEATHKFYQFESLSPLH